MSPAELFLSLSESSDHLYFAYDAETKAFTSLNRAFQDFFDLVDVVADIETLAAQVHPEDKDYLFSKIKECQSGATIKNTECRFVRNGSERWLRITAEQSKTDARYIAGFAEDITVLKEQSEMLNLHNNKKNSILNILAHDLAGPIGTIQNLSIILGRETSALKNEMIDNHVAMVAKISKSSINLIRDFLNQEFLESAGVKLLKNRVELIQKLAALNQQYAETQRELKVQFVFKANRDVIYVEIDEDKFMQVINNLISNSLKFTPDGGTITIDIEEKDTSVIVSVADTGIGIPEKYHATLFDKFSDARRNGLKGEHSTGLGMSIIKTIVEWHQANIWFTSAENKGTTFFIELPK